MPPLSPLFWRPGGGGGVEVTFQAYDRLGLDVVEGGEDQDGDEHEQGHQHEDRGQEEEPGDEVVDDPGLMAHFSYPAVSMIWWNLMKT